MPLDLFSPDTHVSAAGRWLVLGILFVLGAVLGSFINVVAYRLPRRMSLSWPGSRCPACEHPIRWYDNLPIVGWLQLRGRCRDCGTSISARYPLVEAMVALSSALLGWSVISQVAPAAPELGAAFSIDFPRYAFWMLLVCTLVTAALIEFDGSQPPMRMLLPVLVAGILLASIWPDLRVGRSLCDGAFRGVCDTAAGLAAAAVLGGLAWPALVAGAQRPEIVAAAIGVAELALVGVFLGPSAAPIVAAIAMFCYAVLRALERVWRPARSLGWACCLAAATLIWIVVWPLAVARIPGLTEQYDATVPIAAGVLVALLALAARIAGSAGGRSRGAVGD